MNDPASRYSVLESLPAAPGYDWITRSIIGPFIDTGVNVEFAQTGRLYLSKATVQEMAEAFGITGEKSSAELTAEAQSYFRGYADAVKENGIGQLNDFVDRLTAVAAALERSAVGESGPVEVPREVKTPDVAPPSDYDYLPEENESGIFTTDGPVAGQDDRPTVNEGPALVSSSSGDVHRL